jgi:hypothetical protein
MYLGQISFSSMSVGKMFFDQKTCNRTLQKTIVRDFLIA